MTEFITFECFLPSKNKTVVLQNCIAMFISTVKGNIRTVIGQVQLLVTKKFKQFSGLLDLSEVRRLCNSGFSGQLVGGGRVLKPFQNHFNPRVMMFNPTVVPHQNFASSLLFCLKSLILFCKGKKRRHIRKFEIIKCTKAVCIVNK
jgi:hypothetical protein